MNDISEKELENMDFGQVLSAYRDQQHMHSFEGNSGMEKLNNLCEAIGYSSHGFKFGSSLEVFLSDNPGACDAIVEWLYDNGQVSGDEWRDNLASEITVVSDEEEE